MHDAIEQHQSAGRTYLAYFRKLLFPKHATLMYLFWVMVFLLVFLLIYIVRTDVARNGDIVASFARSQANWVLEPYVDPRRGADHTHRELLSMGAQFFSKGKQSEAFVTLVDRFADDIRNGTFNEQSANEFVSAARSLYIVHEEYTNEILKKSGFHYFYLLMIVIAIYQLFVNAVYFVLDSTPGDGRDNATFLTEGAFNAIDLTILAALTYMYFDVSRPTLGAVVFLSYFGHMFLFGIFLSQITNRRTMAALSAYFLSVLMTLIMAGIENTRYLMTGTVAISLCVILTVLTVRVIMPRVGGIGRFAPYIPGPTSTQHLP